MILAGSRRLRALLQQRLLKSKDVKTLADKGRCTGFHSQLGQGTTAAESLAKRLSCTAQPYKKVRPSLELIYPRRCGRNMGTSGNRSDVDERLHCSRFSSVVIRPHRIDFLKYPYFVRISKDTSARRRDSIVQHLVTLTSD